MKLLMALTAFGMFAFGMWGQDRGIMVSTADKVYVPPPITYTIEIHMMCFDDATQLWNRCRKEQPHMEAAEGMGAPKTDNIIMYMGKGKLTKDGNIVLEQGVTQEEFLRAAITAIINYKNQEAMRCDDEKHNLNAVMDKCMRGWKRTIDSDKAASEKMRKILNPTPDKAKR